MADTVEVQRGRHHGIFPDFLMQTPIAISLQLSGIWRHFKGQTCAIYSPLHARMLAFVHRLIFDKLRSSAAARIVLHVNFAVCSDFMAVAPRDLTRQPWETRAALPSKKVVIWSMREVLPP